MRTRKAFSMIELIFVIVVLGIVASLGSEMIARVYKSYILQRALHRAEIKTELAALEIANRLTAAIPGTVYRKKRDSSGEAWIEEITEDLGHPLQSNQYNVLQWVGADLDSRDANATPGWSGFCDVNNPSTDPTHIYTPGSNLDFAKSIIKNLNGGTLPAAWKPAVYFYGDYNGSDVDLSHTSGKTIALTTGTAPSAVTEHYKLAWTSYALVVEPETVDGKTYNSLYLYYGFDPKPAWTIPNGTNKSLLLRNVTTFKFRGNGRTIRFKICKSEKIGEDYNITACKEKAVF